MQSVYCMCVNDFHGGMSCNLKDKILPFISSILEHAEFINSSSSGQRIEIIFQDMRVEHNLGSDFYFLNVEL